MTGLFYKFMFPTSMNKVFSAWNKVMARVLNIVYPMWCKKHKKDRGLNHLERDVEIVVSLTSFPARFEKLPLTIESIFHQTVKPDRIVLWLIESECEGIELSSEIKEFLEYGLEIRYAKVNLKPHNKFIFSAMEFKNSIIISIDDDTLYDSKMIEYLIKGYEKHPNCVICNMAHQIVLDNNEVPDLYTKWNGAAVGLTGPSHDLTALGVGGVLYPPNIFDSIYFDFNLIKNLSLTADDLWLKYNEVRLGYMVYKVKPYAKNPVVVRGTQEIALTRENNGNRRNDTIIKALNLYFDIEWKQKVSEKEQ